MKNVLFFALFCFALFGFANPVFSYPTSVTVNSLNNNNIANDPASDWTDGFSVYFPAGQYKFSVADGAWLPWLTVSLPSQGWLWTLNIYQESTAIIFALGSADVRYLTPSAALNAHLGESIIINQPTDGNLWFYVGDNYVFDNSGTVTASVNAVTATPEPATMLLIGLGLAGLAGVGRFRK